MAVGSYKSARYGSRVEADFLGEATCCDSILTVATVKDLLRKPLGWDISVQWNSERMALTDPEQ